MIYETIKPLDFDSIRLKVASPEEIKNWSNGEITKPETINYRTQKPEKDGLFCERIFGPTKDWECYCGKYKKIRYKGIICDKCGVEVTHSLVRRERMGHIELSVPVTHIWFLRGVPSRIGLVLDISAQSLEKVVYFASFIVMSVDEDLKLEAIDGVKAEFKSRKKQIESHFKNKTKQLKDSKDLTPKKLESELKKLEDEKDKEVSELDAEFSKAEKELKELKKNQIISEDQYQDLSLRFGHVFDAGIGAEAINDLLTQMDLDKTIIDLDETLIKATGAKKDKMVKRMKLLKNLQKNEIAPSWMVLKSVPVIPPDLRPMVPLDGGRFATSDLNDLYRRVINRNNRLKKLKDLNAPEVIIRNEKRMLQEAADALLDNSARQSKTTTASTGQKRQLKSIADLLKGKQGRFRQNLLGKRVDYSGRSVIVVGANLNLNQCGIPKKMALELFRPFIIAQLIKREYVHNIRSANRFIEMDRSEVWDILEEITKDAHVLLNRAPTLHRLGIQAFQPVLIEGKAIQLHPLVCSAFNADFDGDQMAVHVPLTEEAKREAREIMESSKNLIKPAHGSPVVSPDKDIIWGCFYITTLDEREDPKVFASFDEALLAYNMGIITVQEQIKVRGVYEEGKPAEIVDTNVGRILLNQVLPDEVPFLNKQVNNKILGPFVRDVIGIVGDQRTAEMLDGIKTLGYHHLTLSGYSWGMDDLPTLEEKDEIIAEGEKQIEEVNKQFAQGYLTKSERYSKIIEIWTEAKDKVIKITEESLPVGGSAHSMIASGARGSLGQVVQMVGMKGLVANPAGDIIELPVKRSFKEGFDVLEYFISTHGSRKGLSDTALRTANAGYLTRRLIDVAQDVVIMTDDCGDKSGTLYTKEESEEIGVDIIDRVWGRISLEKVIDPKTKETVVAKNELITDAVAKKLRELDLEQIKVRSVLSCKLSKGLCRHCYGLDLGRNALVELGVSAGIIAAQSIGEPGTQLTMRTFHTGGVAGSDITQGLPRVEELFEARMPKRKAFIAEEAGKISISKVEKTIESIQGRTLLTIPQGSTILKVLYQGILEDDYQHLKSADVKVKEGATVKRGDVLFNDGSKDVVATRGGVAKVSTKVITVVSEGTKEKEYIIPPGYRLWVKDGDNVVIGDQLTEGSIDLHQLFKLKGKDDVKKSIVKEIQYIYSSQGQRLNEKHIELIIRQLFSRVLVLEPNDTELLPGEIIEKAELEEANVLTAKKNKKEATYEELFLGITKVSLSTRSFLSAASFIETSRVLINAAITGKIDKLEGLKENVIIGRLIPAGTGFQPAEEQKKKLAKKKAAAKKA